MIPDKQDLSDSISLWTGAPFIVEGSEDVLRWVRHDQGVVRLYVTLDPRRSIFEVNVRHSARWRETIFLPPTLDAADFIGRLMHECPRPPTLTRWLAKRFPDHFVLKGYGLDLLSRVLDGVVEFGGRELSPSATQTIGETCRRVLGEDLANEAMHAALWDVDWSKVYDG